MIVGISKNADACSSIADGWPRGAADGLEAAVAPPLPLEEIGRRAGVVILEAGGEALRSHLAVLRPLLSAGSVLVCTAPCVSIDGLRSLAGSEPALFRAVIPLGSEPGEGAVALAPEPGTSPQIVELVSEIFSGVGIVEIVNEDALDAVAALALGGAALVCEALQGMEDGAVRDGLPRDTARAFTHHTALATALLLRDHAGSPADLKDQVASPGGTTIAALAGLEDAGVRGAYLRAVEQTAVEVRRQRDAARTGMVE